MERKGLTIAEARKMLADMKVLIDQMEADARLIRQQYNEYKTAVESVMEEEMK